MNILITGSAGHLGEALMRVLKASGEHVAVGLDQSPSAWTTHVGSILDADFVATCMRDMDAVIHTAGLHKPHLASCSKQDFIDVNVSGTLILLEAAAASGVSRFVYTSTSNVFARHTKRAPGQAAAWISDALRPWPQTVYGTSKLTGEELCEVFWLEHELPSVVLRASRFFPKELIKEPCDRLEHDNIWVNDLAYHRVALEDVVSAHLCALERAPDIGHGRYLLSATTPLRRSDVEELGQRAGAVLWRRTEAQDAYAELSWEFPETLQRVYDNARAREELGWTPRCDFATALRRVMEGGRPFGDLTYEVGSKGYGLD